MPLPGGRAVAVAAAGGTRGSLRPGRRCASEARPSSSEAARRTAIDCRFIVPVIYGHRWAPDGRVCARLHKHVRETMARHEKTRGWGASGGGLRRHAGEWCGDAPSTTTNKRTAREQKVQQRPLNVVCSEASRLPRPVCTHNLLLPRLKGIPGKANPLSAENRFEP